MYNIGPYIDQNKLRKAKEQVIQAELRLIILDNFADSSFDLERKMYQAAVKNLHNTVEKIRQGCV